MGKSTPCRQIFMNIIKVLLVLGITALILIQASELMNEDNLISLSSNVPVSSSLERVLGRADIQVEITSTSLIL